ncbi:MAG: virulence protein RhuM/Fic/DOC family protein [Bacteroidales bacterium]|nr:virulence protein RhuM/Fic/DOC family protein [Bacteroidales bacterium]
MQEQHKLPTQADKNYGEVIMYQTDDGQTQLDVRLENDTIWLTANQMALLFGRDEKTIRKHINNVFLDGELVQMNNTHFLRVVGVKQPVAFYTLDVIISVGYRVKSIAGTKFRIWANSVLKEYLLRGYAVNEKRSAQLGQVIQILKRSENMLDSKQVLSVVEKFNTALNLLDSYDHQTMRRPKGNKSVYVLTYEECRSVIESMRFGNESPLFGKEKDDSFKGSIGNIYQSFDGTDVYPSLEEKAANLLYFVTKNHSFVDGNKRIAATMFLYFLDKNGALFVNGRKTIDDYTLVALTIMIAESRSEEKEMMISVIMNCLG